MRSTGSTRSELVSATPASSTAASARCSTKPRASACSRRASTPRRASHVGAGGRFVAGSRVYPLFVHEGTGLYGPLKRAITPKRAKFMVFLGRTGLVKTKSVKGQRPQPYMEHAYDDARAYIEMHLDDIANSLFE
jgi:hypothetical protein